MESRHPHTSIVRTLDGIMMENKPMTPIVQGMKVKQVFRLSSGVVEHTEVLTGIMMHLLNLNLLSRYIM